MIFLFNTVHREIGQVWTISYRLVHFAKLYKMNLSEMLLSFQTFCFHQAVATFNSLQYSLYNNAHTIIQIYTSANVQCAILKCIMCIRRWNNATVDDQVQLYTSAIVQCVILNCIFCIRRWNTLYLQLCAMFFVQKCNSVRPRAIIHIYNCAIVRCALNNLQFCTVKHPTVVWALSNV